MTDNNQDRRISRRTLLLAGATSAAGLGALGTGAALRGSSDPHPFPETLEQKDVVAALESTPLVIRGFDSLSEEYEQRLPRTQSNVDRLEDAELAILTRSHFPEHERLVTLLNGGTVVSLADMDASRAFFATLYDIDEDTITVNPDTEPGIRPDPESLGPPLAFSFGISLSPDAGRYEVQQVIPPEAGGRAGGGAGSRWNSSNEIEEQVDDVLLAGALSIYVRNVLRLS